MEHNRAIEGILKALDFVARKHQHQRRKDKDASPYINHLIAVVTTLCEIGKIDDSTILVAAILHDTLEDTETTLEEIERKFGKGVGQLVVEVTDDKNLSKHIRKQLQIERAAKISYGAKCIKLADKISNIQDIIESPPANWSSQRKLEYVNWAKEVIDELRGTHEKLEDYFDGVCHKAEAKLHLEGN